MEDTREVVVGEMNEREVEARLSQGEDHIPPCPHGVPHGEHCPECELAASGEDSPRGEDHEAGIEAAARIIRDELPYAVKHSTATRIAGLILSRRPSPECEIVARGPRDDDAEKMDALGTYLEQYPPSGFADRYSADGWRHIARSVLSAAAIFFAAPPPERDTVRLVKALREATGHIDHDGVRARIHALLAEFTDAPNPNDA